MNPEPGYGSPSREATFNKAAEMFRERGGKTIIETGCAWLDSQGNSTYHLAKLAHECGATFYSVDNNPDHVKAATDLIAQYVLECTATVARYDSVVFLSSWASPPIDFLYLDSLDVADNPLAAKLHQVAEMGAAYGKLSPRAIVLLDDWDGGRGDALKPELTRTFLLNRGWDVVVNGFQLLMTKP